MPSHARANAKKLMVRKIVPGCLGLCASQFKELNAHVEVGRASQQHNTNSINTAPLNYSAVKKIQCGFGLALSG